MVEDTCFAGVFCSSWVGIFVMDIQVAVAVAEAVAVCRCVIALLLDSHEQYFRLDVVTGFLWGAALQRCDSAVRTFAGVTG